MSILPLVGYIELTRGKVAIVDFEDVEWLSQFKWQCNDKGYAGRRGGIFMHVEIMRRHGIEPGKLDVDHRDGNPSNNSFSNLRLATRSQNCINAPKPCNNTSGYKGVTWNARLSKWAARIGCNWERKFLGYYDSPIDAAKAYNMAAIDFFGEYAKLNALEDGTELGILENGYAQRAKQTKKLTAAKRSSIYKGVSPTSFTKNKPVKKWLSQIFAANKRNYLGTFASQEDAAYIFNQVCLLLYGDNAVLNQLPENYEPSESITQLHCNLPKTEQTK